MGVEAESVRHNAEKPPGKELRLASSVLPNEAGIICGEKLNIPKRMDWRLRVISCAIALFRPLPNQEDDTSKVYAQTKNYKLWMPEGASEFYFY